MTDEISIIHTPRSYPSGGDAVTVEVRYGQKSATVLLKSAEGLRQMTTT
jgi:hypothetical protein